MSDYRYNYKRWDLSKLTFDFRSCLSQPEYPRFATPRRTARDHPYAKKPQSPEPSPPSSPEKRVRGRPRTKLLESVTEEDSPQPLPDSPMTSAEPTPTKKKESDSDYDATGTSSQSSSSESDPPKSPARSHCEEQKYIVFEGNLQELLRRCSHEGCAKAVLELDKHTVGTMVMYSGTCVDNHENMWRSQPLIGRRPAGNIAVSATTLLSGNSYAKMLAFANTMNLQFLSRNSYQDVCTRVVYPIIQEAWLEDKKRLREKATGLKLVLAGDGRCDR